VLDYKYLSWDIQTRRSYDIKDNVTYRGGEDLRLVLFSGIINARPNVKKPFGIQDV